MSSNSASAHSCEDTTSPAPEGVAPMIADTVSASGLPQTANATESQSNSPSQFAAEAAGGSANLQAQTAALSNTRIPVPAGNSNGNEIGNSNGNGAAAVNNGSAGAEVTPSTVTPDGINACPTVEMKLFVGRVPRNIEEKELKPIFEEFGAVREVVIIKDKTTGQHKGSAFIRMASLTSSDAAIRTLHNQRVLDHGLGALQVRYATGEIEKLGLSNDGAIPGQDEAKLFVGSIPKTATEEEVKQVFEAYGTINEVFIMKDMTTGLGRGCSFVKFAFKEQAVNAIEKLNQKYTMAGATRPMEVRFAEHKKAQQAGPSVAAPNIAVQAPVTGLIGARPMTQAATAVSNSNPRQIGQWKEYFSPDGRPYYHSDITNVTQWDPPLEFQYLSSQIGQHQHMNPAGAKTNTNDPTGPPGANVFIFHVPNDWTNNELTNAFGQFGHVVSAHIATDKASGRNRGFAFVSYDDTKAAVAAVTHMNGFMVHGKRLKVSIKSGEESFVRHLMPPNGSIGQPTHTQAMNVSQAVPQMGSQLGLNSIMNAQIAAAPPLASTQQAVPAAAPGYAGFAGYAAPHGGEYYINNPYPYGQPQYGQSQFQSQMDKQQYNKQYEQQGNPQYTHTHGQVGGNVMEGQPMDMSAAYHPL